VAWRGVKKGDGRRSVRRLMRKRSSRAAFGEQSRRLFTACRRRSALWQEGAMTSREPLTLPFACPLPAFAWRLRQSDVEAASGVLHNPTDCGRQRRNTIHVSPRPHLTALDITAKPPSLPTTSPRAVEDTPTASTCRVEQRRETTQLSTAKFKLLSALRASPRVRL
jgi:hypothetical protein